MKGTSRFAGLRAKYAEELAARRKAAEEEVELLRESVSKKVQNEKSKDGKHHDRRLGDTMMTSSYRSNNIGSDLRRCAT